MSDFVVRRLVFPADEAAFRNLRQEALTRAATGFRTTAADDAANPRRLDVYTPQADHAVFGAFDNEHLVGMLGFERETRTKLQHKGLVWGMYVRMEVAGRGLGRQLLRAALAHARTLPGMEQVLLTVVASNLNARHLYVSEGFETIGREPRALKWEGHYFDEETMVLFLK